MFLLDTNVVSHASKKKQNPTVSEWLKSQQSLAIPFPVILEIHRGIVSLAPRNPERALELAAWLESVLDSDFFYPALTTDVAFKLAELYCCRPLKNLWYVNGGKEAVPGQDLFIAAIAIVYNLPIATLDWLDFQRINRYFPLPGLYNPADDLWLQEAKIPGMLHLVTPLSNLAQG